MESHQHISESITLTVSLRSFSIAYKIVLSLVDFFQDISQTQKAERGNIFAFSFLFRLHPRNNFFS